MKDFIRAKDQIEYIFRRENQESLVSNVAAEGGISEDEAWERVSSFFEELLDQDVELEVADFIANELSIQTKRFESLWRWKNENGKLESSSNEELSFKVYREYFNSCLERGFTDEEWSSIIEVFQGAVSHDLEVDLKLADPQDFLDQ